MCMTGKAKALALPLAAAFALVASAAYSTLGPSVMITSPAAGQRVSARLVRLNCSPSVLR
jgi:hypothetical protein